MEDQNCPDYEPLNVSDQLSSDEQLPHFGQIGAIALLSAISCALFFLFFFYIWIAAPVEIIALAMAINLMWSKSRIDRVCGGIKLVVAACLYTLFIVWISHGGGII